MRRVASGHCPSPSLALGGLLVLAACGGPGANPPSAAPPLPPASPQELRGPEAFAAIADRDERSRALFAEASKVIFHPRCVNCHPSDDSPRQSDSSFLHDPPVTRGEDGHGVVSMRCGSCHQDKNLELARVPGAPDWHLAPKTMAWIGHSPAAVCAQIKDPARNGGRTLDKIVDHAAHDAVVAWGWAPGHGRTPAPGTQERFGALVAAWVESGAACPAEEAKR